MQPRSADDRHGIDLANVQAQIRLSLSLLGPVNAVGNSSTGNALALSILFGVHPSHKVGASAHNSRANRWIGASYRGVSRLHGNRLKGWSHAHHHGD